ncbi:brf1 [Acrasis kona]|uniref:B-related factor 1 n=1 Tax=Acrasis kona TaxID=1008807 RepID=A0AAW2YIW6_9EUKA
MGFCISCDKEVEVAHEQTGTVCMECGAVVEDLALAEDAAFAENHLGAATLLGTVVRNNEGTALLRGLAGATSDSREVTINKALLRFNQIADLLSIPKSVVDGAMRTFRMALSQRFTKGRRADHVAAACLYTACRIAKTSHMLLDFSEVLEDDVFVIGGVFVQLQRELKMELPVAEPLFYVRRFCSHMEFEEKTNEVIKTALQLISSMNRDWMNLGRRPAGICAAAILIAARIHGFRRSNQDIIQYARICAGTLGKRLKEFENTEASNMTVDEFAEYAAKLDDKSYDGPQADPPAFTNSEKKKLQLQELKKIQERAEQDRRDYLVRKYGSVPADANPQVLQDTEDEINNVLRDEGLEQFGEDFQDMIEQSDNGTTVVEPVLKVVKEKEQPIKQSHPVTPKSIEDDFDLMEKQFEADAELEEEDDLDDGQLDELDDAELKAYIITDRNIIKSKDDVWEDLNGEFLRERERKRQERIQNEEEGERPRKKRKKRDTDQEDEAPAQSAAEAAASLMKKGLIAKRSGLNVENLFDFGNEDEYESNEVNLARMDELLTDLECGVVDNI